ncbi:hypothetical protein BO78DRAFT_318411, partial [Aspergillus sclerotiicarbonarius CBS 121057]
SPSYRPSSFCARDQLESLIARHGHPTRVSLSSLQELTATSSTYNPPSPDSSSSDTTDSVETLILTQSTSRPIPIPKPSPNTHDKDLPVTPLTGRFDKGYYFAHRDQTPEGHRERHSHRRSGRPGHRSHHSPSSRMRSDNSTFYPPAVSPSMAPTGRPASPQPSRSRAQNTSKSMPAFHLGSLPRFHPAVYQSSGSPQGQPSSPRQSRQHGYRTSSGSRDTMWQLVEGSALPKTPSRTLSPSPSAPRLDPLRSPGPVTPLALEEAGGYLASGISSSSEFSSRDHSGAAPDLVDRLIARENERNRQKSMKSLKGF